MTEGEKDHIARMVLALVREVLATTRTPELEPTSIRVHPKDRQFVDRRAS